MKQYKRLLLLIGVIVILACLAIIARAQDDEPVWEEEDQQSEPVAPAPNEIELLEPEAPISVTGSPVGTAFRFSYPRQIKLGGQPVNGNCDVNFSLFDAESGGVQVGTTLTKVISIQNGRFNTVLDFGIEPFQGQARWMELAVRCPAGSGNFTTITPREPMYAVPVAITLRPGTRILADVPGHSVLNATNTSTASGAGTRGFFGQTYGPQGVGVRGGAEATSGVNVGTQGYTRSPQGYGGYFYNVSGSGVGLYARGGRGYQPDIVLGGNSQSGQQPGEGDDGLIVSDPAYFWSDIVLSTRDKMIVVIGRNGAGHGDSYFNVRSPSRRDLFSVYPDGRVSLPVLQITGGSDLSEQFDIQAYQNRIQPEPGLVVCIDAENPGELVVCNGAYNHTVAGVISGAGGVETGMMMGHDGTLADGEHPVALTGRVYVSADASYGAIQPGDLLTTSNTPGYAMKVKDHDLAQGAVLGKAMTSLDEGRGLVLVLVSLQ